MKKYDTEAIRDDGVEILIDKELCISAASCVLAAKGVFQLDGEQKAYIVDANSEDLISIVDAAKSCPVDAITIKDSNGKQLWPM